MSNEFLQAAADAKRLLRGFASVQTLADAFEKVGSLEQAGVEAEAKLAALTPQVEAAAEQIALAANVEREVAKAAKQTAADAKAAADAVLAAAHAEAGVLRTNAETLCDIARAQADSIVLEAEAKSKAAAEARDVLAAEVADLEARADKARAYLAKLAG